MTTKKSGIVGTHRSGTYLVGFAGVGPLFEGRTLSELRYTKARQKNGERLRELTSED